MIRPPYRPSFVFYVSDADIDWARDSCPTGLHMHEVPYPARFSCECALYSWARETNGSVLVKGQHPLHAGDRTQATAFRFRWTRECCVLFGNVGDVAQTAAQRQGEFGWHLAAARWGTNTLRSFCAQRFEGTFSRPLGWPWFTDNPGTINMTTA